MRTAAIILGVVAATLLLSQDAFARGGKQKSKGDRQKPTVEVVKKPSLERGRRTPARATPVVVAKSRPETVVVHREAEPRNASRHRHSTVRQRPRHEVGRRVHRHHSHCEFIPGHYERRPYEVVVPGHYRDEVIAPKYVEACGPRGFRVKIMIRPGGVRKVWVPATTVTRYERVWVEGHYACGR